MRKYLKNNILNVFKTIYEAHRIVKDFIDKKEYDYVRNLLADCQDSAIQIGNQIEKVEGEGFVTITLLEEYCELLFEVVENLSEISVGSKIQKRLDKKLLSVENSVKNDVKVQLEVVFMPYKASMWDSLESIWQAADEDPDCDAYVVPIPYYDRNHYGAFAEFHYEGGDYPEYVPIVHYNEYSLQQRCPDIIYIHNPYDGNNYVTSVDPRFYSSELKKYTEQLVYVPYCVLHKKRLGVICANAIWHADTVIVQNSIVHSWVYQEKTLGMSKDVLNKKLHVFGSPKIDKMVHLKHTKPNVPQEWENIIGDRKVIFLNTNVSLLLRKSECFIEDIKKMLTTFEMHKEQWAVIWREHPLTMGTIKSMRPELMNDYLKLKELFVQSKIGVIDDTPDPYLAMLISDCYYGAGGSLVVVYAALGKPALITTYKNLNEISEKEINIEELMDTGVFESEGKKMRSIFYREKNINSLDVFLRELDKLEGQKTLRMEALKRIVTNIEGTVGKNIHEFVKNRL